MLFISPNEIDSINKNNYSFQRCIAQCFVYNKLITESNPKKTSKDLISPQMAPSAPITFSNIQIASFWLSKEFLVKLKQLKLLIETNNRKLYAQASKLNM